MNAIAVAIPKKVIDSLPKPFKNFSSSNDQTIKYKVVYQTEGIRGITISPTASDYRRDFRQAGASDEFTERIIDRLN